MDSTLENRVLAMKMLRLGILLVAAVVTLAGCGPSH